MRSDLNFCSLFSYKKLRQNFRLSTELSLLEQEGHSLNRYVEEAVSYMEDMDDMEEKMSFPCSTNNPVVDILVGNKLGIAKSMGIDAESSLFLPYPCGLKDIDICIVLSNVNAVAEKYGGAMSIETQGHVFVLHVLLILSQHSEGIPQQMD